MNSDIQIFARNLRLLRKDKGWTQTKLAEQVGLTKQSIINYEKGITFPTGNRLTKLVEVLEVTPEQLLGENVVQSHTEIKVLKLLHSKAEFQIGYEQQIDINPTELRHYFLEQFNSMTDSELYDAIRYVHDKKIKQAMDKYVDEVTDIRLTTSSNSLDFDINVPTD